MVTFWDNPDRVADLVRIISILNDKTEQKGQGNGKFETDTPRQQKASNEEKSRKQTMPGAGVFVPGVHDGVVLQALQIP